MPDPDLVFRLTSAAAPPVAAAVDDLVRDVFEMDLSPLDRLGRDPSLLSFGWWRGDELVAHVGLARQTLRAAGGTVTTRGLQSVAVREAWRGRGLFRDLTTRALAHVDALGVPALLATETPALYRPFGFREIDEVVFLGPLTPAGARPRHRRLSLDGDDDVALIRDFFARRAPVSELCALEEHPSGFLLKALESPEIALEHLPDLDAVVAVETEEPGCLTLLDVLAPAIPPLAAIAAALAADVDRARVAVMPDRLDWHPTGTRREDAGDMVRGPWPLDGHAVAFSPMRV